MLWVSSASKTIDRCVCAVLTTSLMKKSHACSIEVDWMWNDYFTPGNERKFSEWRRLVAARAFSPTNEIAKTRINACILMVIVSLIDAIPFARLSFVATSGFSRALLIRRTTFLRFSSSSSDCRLRRIPLILMQGLMVFAVTTVSSLTSTTRRHVWSSTWIVTGRRDRCRLCRHRRRSRRRRHRLWRWQLPTKKTTIRPTFLWTWPNARQSTAAVALSWIRVQRAPVRVQCRRRCISPTVSRQRQLLRRQSGNWISATSLRRHRHRRRGWIDRWRVQDSARLALASKERRRLNCDDRTRARVWDESNDSVCQVNATPEFCLSLLRRFRSVASRRRAVIDLLVAVQWR